MTLVLMYALILASGAAAEPVPADPDDLAAGIAQVKNGDLDEAVITLDAAARRLSAGKGQGRNLARAYAYLAIAYMGLSQRVSARASFLEAWKADKTLTLSPKEFPAQAIALFEDTRREAESATAEKKGGGGKGLLIGGAAAAGAAGVGIAVLAGGHPSLTGTWTGTMIMSGMRCDGDVTCPADLENVSWSVTQTGESWTAIATHTLVSYEGGSPLCSNGEALSTDVGATWAYATHGLIRWPNLVRDDALGRIWGGCTDYRVDGDTITANCTITQAACTFAQAWRLKRS